MIEYSAVYPELILVLTLAGLIAGEIGYHGEKYRLASVISLVGLGAAIVQIFLTYKPGVTPLFENAVSMDGISLFFRLFFLALAFLVVVMVACGDEIAHRRRTEYYVFIIASCLTMCFASSAVDIILIFVSLQCMNCLNYFVAGYLKKRVESVEAAVKYLFF